jgi:hypothetical protein
MCFIYLNPKAMEKLKTGHSQGRSGKLIAPELVGEVRVERFESIGLVSTACMNSDYMRSETILSLLRNSKLFGTNNSALW